MRPLRLAALFLAVALMALSAPVLVLAAPAETLPSEPPALEFPPIDYRPGPEAWSLDRLPDSARAAFAGQIVLTLDAETASRHLFLEACAARLPEGADPMLRLVVNGLEQAPLLPARESGYRLIPKRLLLKGENVIEIGAGHPISWARLRLSSVPDDNSLTGCGKCGGVRPVWMEPAPEGTISLLDLPLSASFGREGAFDEEGYGATALQRQYDALEYDLTLNFADPLDGSFESVTTMIAEVVAGPLASLQIDLDASLTVASIEARLLPEGVFAAVNWTAGSDQDAGSVFLDPPGGAPLETGQQFETRIAYSGSPVLEGFFGVWLNQNGDVTSVGVPFESSKWWPCKDWPEDKAVVSLTISAGDELLAVGNGHLVSVVDDGAGRKTWRYESQYPVATYNVVCNVGDFTLQQDSFELEPGVSMPVKYYFEASLVEPLPAWLTVTTSLDIFHETFGPYPYPEDGYGMVASDVGGGMEHQTIPSMGRNLNSELTVAHELAHQWFGDAVNVARWGHTWLSEGFATYAEAVYLEATRGRTAYLNHVNSWKPELSSSGSVLVRPENTANPFLVFSNKVYDKGGLVLHALRGRIGDEAFFECLRQYVTSPELRYGNARSADFEAVCEAVSGEDLTGFFNGWLNSPTRPRARWGFSFYQDDFGRSWIAIDTRQFPTEVTFDLKQPVDVTLEDGSTVQVFMRSTATTFQGWEFELPGPGVSAAARSEYWLGDYFLSTTGATLQIRSEMPNEVAAAGLPFARDLIASGSPTGATVSVDADFGEGILPPGLSIVNMGNIQRIEGTPTEAGSFEFRLKINTTFFGEPVVRFGPPMRITVFDGSMASSGVLAR
jgi:hypothetical protein